MIKLFKSKIEKDIEIIKGVLLLAIPIILANLLQSAYYMIDAYWLGHIGKEAVATMTTSSPIIMLLSAIGIGLSVGCSALVAQYYGAKKFHKIGFIAAQTMLLSIVAAFLVNIIGFIAAPHILNLMNVDSLIYNDALTFIRISCIGLFFSFIYMCFAGIMRAIGKPLIPVYVQLGGVILNFILAPFLVFGLFGILGLGIKGAAIITVICQFVAMSIAIYILIKGNHGVKITLSDFKPDKKIITKSILIGIPSSLEQSARNVSMMLLLSIINTFGIVAAAAYGASFNVTQIVLFTAMGFGIATGIVVGQHLGAGKMKEAKEIAKKCANFSGITFFFISIILWFLAEQIVTIFIPGEPETIVLATQAVRIMAAGYFLLGANMALGNSLIAAGKTNITMTITMTTQLLCMLPIAFFLSKYTSLGITGIWIAFPVTNLINLILTFLYFTFANWNKTNLVKS